MHCLLLQYVAGKKEEGCEDEYCGGVSADIGVHGGMGIIGVMRKKEGGEACLHRRISQRIFDRL